METMSGGVLRVAAVQAGPVLPMDRLATIQKACRLIREAAGQGARLMVFPEAFVPMYPTWPVDLESPQVWRTHLLVLTQQAVTVPGPEVDELAAVARETESYVVIGINERVPVYEGTLYNSVLFLSPEGAVLGVHRKLVPSNRERVFWARGDGSSLRAYSTAVGRLGALICYEHLQPLMKYALMAQGEQIHCALWPGRLGQGNNRDVMEIASRQYALEAQCFVVASGMYVPPEAAETARLREARFDFFGGSCIIGPSGRYLAGPLYDREGILYADLDFRDILLQKTLVDTTGRDHRWDVLQLAYRPGAWQPFANESTRSST